MEKFKDKITIITGGASGIGRAVGEEMARRGAVLVLADRNGELLEETVESINLSGGKAKAVILDVTDAGTVKTMIEDTAREYGRLDYLFNNAGIGISGEVRDLELEDWYRTFDINLRGVVHGVHAAYPIMVEQGFGHIFNTASLAGLGPVPGLAPYAATKHAVVGLSTSLRAEGAALGVKVSVVCPGVIRTPLIETLEIKNEEKLGFDSRDSMIEAMPLKPYPVEKAARDIVAGVARNKAIIVVTGHAKLLWFLYRICPPLVIALWRWGVNDFRKKYRNF